MEKIPDAYYLSNYYYPLHTDCHTGIPDDYCLVLQGKISPIISPGRTGHKPSMCILFLPDTDFVLRNPGRAGGTPPETPDMIPELTHICFTIWHSILQTVLHFFLGMTVCTTLMTNCLTDLSRDEGVQKAFSRFQDAVLSKSLRKLHFICHP